MNTLLKLVLLFSFIGASLQARKGIIELDDVSWGRIVDGSKNVLVAFVEYSWKDPTDYEKVSEEFKDSNVIIAKVDCSSNEELKKKYEVTSTPSFRFFPKGGNDASPLIYTGSEKPEELIDFIKIQLNPQLLELKNLASKFVSGGDRAAIVKQAEDIVKALPPADEEYGKIYLANFKKITEKGEDFVKNEKERLNGLIDNKSTTAKKKSEFTKRLNILNAFASQVV